MDTIGAADGKRWSRWIYGMRTGESVAGVGEEDSVGGNYELGITDYEEQLGNQVNHAIDIVIFDLNKMD